MNDEVFKIDCPKIHLYQGPPNSTCCCIATFGAQQLQQWIEEFTPHKIGNHVHSMAFKNLMSGIDEAGTSSVDDPLRT